MKTAVLITIGDEILSGNTVDTNSNFIATQLKEIGIKVLSIFTIPDEESAIVATLGRAFEMSDVVFTTGGLGPTKDDITKKAYADFFEDEMIFSDEIYEHLRAYLEKRNHKRRTREIIRIRWCGSCKVAQAHHRPRRECRTR